MPRNKGKKPDTQKARYEPMKPKQPKEEPHFIVRRREAPGCPKQPVGGPPEPLLGWPSKLYHRTNRVAARRIMRHGFTDSTNYYMTQRMRTGAWLSSIPLSFSDGVAGAVLLQVETDLRESELAEYESTEEGKAYREWMVPAAVINRRMKVSVVSSCP